MTTRRLPPRRVRIWQVLLAVYVMSALLAALGGLLFSGISGSVGPDQTNAYLLPSVAAAVIGGTSILGGVGGYTGTILGALILTVLNRLLLTLDTTEAFRQILYGLIVLALAWVYVRSPASGGPDGRGRGTRVGIVGTGWMAATHTEALRRLGVDVAGVAGRTPAQAQGRRPARPGHRLRLGRGPGQGRLAGRRPRDQPQRRPRRSRPRPPCGPAGVVCEKPLGVAARRRPPGWLAAAAAWSTPSASTSASPRTTTTPPAWSATAPLASRAT